ncbi:putative zinc protease y4wA [Planktothrix tepida]|uniref:Peptidase M16-like protein n=1 Tax=Planktothrix tepida PCC 9214 TaxID=671072 RepID=A0A1J1LT16_9CYAN|nr:putative zinc protease y4wA [Planktothrix tepida]CUR34697.1 Peptidase M16-like protein [Planktothrix tepida PCC 9214]
MSLGYFFTGKPRTKKCSFLGQRLFSLVLSICLFWVMGFQTVWADEISPSTHSIQPYLKRVAREITEFTLDNGMRFIVLERHRAPVVSFLIYADVGGVNEPDGQTGVAHYLEHLAFKGTQKIGTTNYEAEKPLFEKQDQIFEQIKQAKAEGNTAKLKQLMDELETLSAEADQYVKQNEFGRIVEQAGGVGMNAATSADATFYFYSLPANKLELWMSLESERFLEPVFREFYKEKQVILEERRLRTENSPVGQMIEEFSATAFKVHPYRRPVIGYVEDLENLTRENVKDFFETHYVPNNLTAVIVGDVNPDDVKNFAEIYFGRYSAKPKPPQLNIVEPPQTEAREITLKLKTQPWYFEGYPIPALNHPDSVIYDLISSLLSDGRTSRLYKSLVEEQKIALAAQGSNGYPGNKYPNLMFFYAMPAPGHTVDEVATALRQEIERFKTELVSETELERVKTQAKAGLLRSLDSNMGMAFALAEYEVKTGSWVNLFEELEKIDAITAQDIQRVAQTMFRPENRTIGRLLSDE